MESSTLVVGRLLVALGLATCIGLVAGCGGGGSSNVGNTLAAAPSAAPLAAPVAAPAPTQASATPGYARGYTLTRVGWYSYDATHSTTPLIANVQTALDDSGQVAGYFTIEACASCAYTVATNGTPAYSDTTNYCMGHAGRMACPSQDTASNAAGVTAGVQLMGMPVYAPYSAAPTYHAFGGTTDLGTLGGTSSYATGINPAGQIVGYSDTSGNSSTQAFLFSAGTMRALTMPGATQSHATAINASGQIAGYAQPAGSTASHGFFYAAGTFKDLGEGQANALNASGQVAGSNSAGAYLSGVNGGALLALGAGTSAGVNAAGQVVINGAGPFLWDGAMQVDLNTIVAPADPLAGQVTLTSAIAINNNGVILVNGHDKDGWQMQFLLAPPPVSSQLATLLAIVKETDTSNTLAAPVAQAQVYSAAGDQANTCRVLAEVESALASGPAHALPSTMAVRLIVDVRVIMSAAGCAY
jgi:probable HAF family extracellular repeat protein